MRLFVCLFFPAAVHYSFYSTSQYGVIGIICWRRIIIIYK